MRLVTKCLAGIEGVDAYIDDIVVYSDTWEDHVDTLKKVLEKLDAANLTVNLMRVNSGWLQSSTLGILLATGKLR